MEQNSELRTAWDFVEHTGRSIFLTGKAGTGKTTFLKTIVERSRKRPIVVAPTGVAAINAGGVTIHSFFQLPFPLIADVDKTLMEAMGAWGEKNMYGRKTMGTIRTTFIINEEGIIEQIFSGKQVNTKEHAAQILQK